MSVEPRLALLERRFRLVCVICLLELGALALILSFAVLPAHVGARNSSAEIIRTRGFIIEDAQGRARILLGAPVPSVSERKRRDEMTGMLFLGESGFDRLSIGAPAPDPQSAGRLSRRIGPAIGMMVNDDSGNERGGLAVLDNDGRVSLGLDYPSGGEAITVGVLKDGPALNIKDQTSLVRAALVLHDDAAAKLYGITWHDKASLDFGMLRLAPYAVKQVVIKPDEKAFHNAIDSMKP